MSIWWTLLTWFLVARFSHSQYNAIQPKDRRLLLNDPNTLLNEIENLKREMTSLKSQVNTLQNRKQEGTGSVYTVWGKTSCPIINGTTTVYTGITGGKPHYVNGGGVDTLCLPHNPDDAPHDFPTSLQSGRVAVLYGSEYEFNYRKFAIDDDVPCAVCHVDSASSVLMIPAKSSCPVSWSMQYNGFLVSNNAAFGDNNWQAFNYVCLHNDAEYLTEGARRHNDDGHILYPVQAVCGSLPCPPYKNGQYITCVVCTV